MYEVYRLQMDFTGRLCGNVPLSKEVVERWVASRASAKPKPGPTLAQIVTEVSETLMPEPDWTDTEEELKLMSVGFQQVNGVLCLRGSTVRAHLKDCALQLQKANPTKENKQIKSMIANRVYSFPYWLTMRRKDGAFVTEPDDYEDRPIQVMTARGQRSALKRFFYVEQPMLIVGLAILKNKEVTKALLERVLEYGGWMHGYSGERSMGEGRYRYTLMHVGDWGESPTPEEENKIVSFDFGGRT